uniref:Cytochrome c oxidase polypeptide VIa n=1 Tax=Felis catus TaxID=9685 RepID=A0ABI8A0V8_FELCA
MAVAAASRFSGLLGRSGAQLGRSMSSGAHGEEGSARMWKALTYFVALPGVGVSMLNVFLKSHHGEHERPEFVAYPHLRIRSKMPYLRCLQILPNVPGGAKSSRVGNHAFQREHAK